MAHASLNQRTLELLRDRPRHMTYVKITEDLQPVVANTTGLTVAWLEQYGSGYIKRPCVHRVQAIYEYLSGEKLFADT